MSVDEFKDSEARQPASLFMSEKQTGIKDRRLNPENKNFQALLYFGRDSFLQEEFAGYFYFPLNTGKLDFFMVLVPNDCLNSAKISGCIKNLDSLFTKKYGLTNRAIKKMQPGDQESIVFEDDQSIIIINRLPDGRHFQSDGRNYGQVGITYLNRQEYSQNKYRLFDE